MSILLVIWIIGVISMFMVNAYFDLDLAEDELILFAAGLWFLFYPVIGLIWLYEKLEKLGEKHRTKKAKREKIRIAEIQEAAELLQVGQEEAEKVLNTRDTYKTL